MTDFQLTSLLVLSSHPRFPNTDRTCNLDSQSVALCLIELSENKKTPIKLTGAAAVVDVRLIHGKLVRSEDRLRLRMLCIKIFHLSIGAVNGCL